MDNKANDYAEWDIDILLKEIEELKGYGFDLDNTGFAQDELDMLFKINASDGLETEGRHNVITVEPPNAPPLKERVSLYCENEEDYFKIKEIFFMKTKDEVIRKILELK
jgi:hypothetical protein